VWSSAVRSKKRLPALPLRVEKLRVKTSDAERLAQEHWKWFSKVIERVYIDAFIHGWKHAKEK
jgi:hypothetical protein